MNQLESLSPYKVAEIELIYKSNVKPRDRIKVVTSQTAFEILQTHWDLNKIELIEQFKVLLLDRASNCLGIVDIASGGVCECPVDAKIIFAPALKAKASQLILAHNHPSGNTSPSQNDIYLTRKLAEGARLLGMTVSDHIVMTSEDYYSFSDNALIP